MALSTPAPRCDISLVALEHKSHILSRVDLCLHSNLPSGVVCRCYGRIIIKNVNLCLGTSDLLSVFNANCSFSLGLSLSLLLFPFGLFMAICRFSVINFRAIRRRLTTYNIWIFIYLFCFLLQIVLPCMQFSLRFSFSLHGSYKEN